MRALSDANGRRGSPYRCRGGAQHRKTGAKGLGQLGVVREVEGVDEVVEFDLFLADRLRPGLSGKEPLGSLRRWQRQADGEPRHRRAKHLLTCRKRAAKKHVTCEPISAAFAASQKILNLNS